MGKILSFRPENQYTTRWVFWSLMRLHGKVSILMEFCWLMGSGGGWAHSKANSAKRP